MTGPFAGPDGIDGASKIVPARAWVFGVGLKTALRCKSPGCTRATGWRGDWGEKVAFWHQGCSFTQHWSEGRWGRMGPDPALATAPIQGRLGQNYVSKKKKGGGGVGSHHGADFAIFWNLTCFCPFEITFRLRIPKF